MKKVLALVTAILLLEIIMSSGVEANPTSFMTKLPEIIIECDGSINPSTEYIEKEGNTYYLTQDIVGKYCIRVQCSDIVLDGKGLMINSNITTNSNGISLNKVNNVVIKNIVVQKFWTAILLQDSNNCFVDYVEADNNHYGIYLNNCSMVTISNSEVTNCSYGVDLTDTYNCTVSSTSLHNDENSIYLAWSNNNTIFNNTIEKTNLAFVIMGPQINPKHQVDHLYQPVNNLIYGNNFLNYTKSVNFVFGSKIYYLSNGTTVEEDDSFYPNFWDYNKTGNYWGALSFNDNNNDGFSDDPYCIFDQYNIDNYPLMTKKVSVLPAQTPATPEYSWIVLPIIMIAILCLIPILKKMKPEASH